MRYNGILNLKFILLKIIIETLNCMKSITVFLQTKKKILIQSEYQDIKKAFDNIKNIKTKNIPKTPWKYS